MIKNNITKILQAIKGLSLEKINNLLNSFLKSRNSRKLSSKYSYLFNYDLNLENLIKNKLNGLLTDCNSDSHLNNIQKDNFNINEKI